LAHRIANNYTKSFACFPDCTDLGLDFFQFKEYNITISAKKQKNANIVNGGEMMDCKMLMEKINKQTFNRTDIFHAAVSIKKDFKETLMRNLIEELQKNGYIRRIARNEYIRESEASEKEEYRGMYSATALNLLEQVERSYPYLNYQIWELMWLNEFTNHLLARNIICLEVENDGCEFVYSTLSPSYTGKILLKPSEKELEYYSVDDGIIINRLVSEAPSSAKNSHQPALEKIIVDLFANKLLIGIISRGDYSDILERMFSKYQIDQKKMFRYARRRNKGDEIARYIRENTRIELRERK
jgi:hypothetical protein